MVILVVVVLTLLNEEEEDAADDEEARLLVVVVGVFDDEGLGVPTDLFEVDMVKDAGSVLLMYLL